MIRENFINKLRKKYQTGGAKDLTSMIGQKGLTVELLLRLEYYLRYTVCIKAAKNIQEVSLDIK